MKPSMQETMDLLHRGMGLFQAGDLNGADFFFRRVIDANPKQFEALHFLGVIEATRGQFEEADRLISRSLKFNTQTPEAYLNHVRILNELKRPKDALKACDRSLALNPNNHEVLFHRGNALQELLQYAEAVGSYDKALAIRSDQAVLWSNRAGALWKLDRFEEAVESFDKALALKPDFAFAWSNRGGTLYKMERYEDALTSYDMALAIDPSNHEALVGRGTALYALARYEDALATRDRAIAIKPDANLWLNRGGTLEQLKRNDEALASYNRAIELDPDLADAWMYGGSIHMRNQNFVEAKRYYEKALELNPSQRAIPGYLVNVRQQMCDWAGLDIQMEQLISEFRTGKRTANSFVASALPTTHEEHLVSTKSYLDDLVPAGLAPLFDPAIARSGRLRIAYVSGDYRNHPTAHCFAEVLERHDRSRFEIIGISVGEDDGSTARARIVGTLDQFHDVNRNTVLDIARLIRDLGVHIAVDLAPHTTGHRPGILAHRPAPIQVTHLSAWTSAANYMDYIIADRHSLPFDQQPYFPEKIVHLPDCFFPRDTTQPISARTPSRAEAGLPDDAFVFCAFNNAYKISRQMFDIWMRLLKAVDNGVIWLSQMNKDAIENLRREAGDRGVDPARLIMAPRVPAMADHLARYRLANLFLDTLPYNAHTTASDALWAGVPVLTCFGQTFVGRVAGSQLHAIGLGELATETLADYEALALQLARDPDRLQALRRKLEQNRSSCPLFNADRLCRHTEAAYLTMWDRYQRGEPPTGFAVTPID